MDATATGLTGESYRGLSPAASAARHEMKRKPAANGWWSVVLAKAEWSDPTRKRRSQAINPSAVCGFQREQRSGDESRSLPMGQHPFRGWRLIHRLAQLQDLTEMIEQQGTTKGAFHIQNPHRETKRMRELLSSDYTDGSGLLNGMRKHKVLRVKVSKAQLRRALYIMDKIIKALESRGAVYVTSNNPERREIRIDNERIECVLIEETKRSKRELNKGEAGHSWLGQWEWHSTGRLRFEIDHYLSTTDAKRWSDSDNSPLEQQIDKIVSGLFRCADDMKKAQIERDAWHRKWEEDRLRQEAAARREAQELSNRKALEEQANQWMSSMQLTSFIDACERRMVAASPGAFAEGAWEVRWLAWARSHAKRLDPFQNNYLESIKRQDV